MLVVPKFTDIFLLPTQCYIFYSIHYLYLLLLKKDFLENG